MSLKPPKKSDLNKSWMKKPDREIRIKPEYHLIVTEGTNTEPAYFGAIKDIINRNYPQKIQLEISGIGNNTINLFEKAKRLGLLKRCSIWNTPCSKYEVIKNNI